MLDQENNFYLISLNILITCLVDNVWLDNKGRRIVQCWSLLGVKLSIKHQETNQNGLVFFSLKRHWLLFDMLMSAFYPKQDFKFLQSALVWKILLILFAEVTGFQHVLQDIFCLGQYSGRYKFINSFTFFFHLLLLCISKLFVLNYWSGILIHVWQVSIVFVVL